MKQDRAFLALWVLAVVSATAAFVLHLSLRVRSVELGYELGRTHARVARLREVKHVLELELASHKTPERVEFVARTLLGMSEPSADRILPAGMLPAEGPLTTEAPPKAPAGAETAP
jgi:cell division protein FtsL